MLVIIRAAAEAAKATAGAERSGRPKLAVVGVVAAASAAMIARH